VTDRVSHPHKIMVLYILKYKYFEGRRKYTHSKRHNWAIRSWVRISAQRSALLSDVFVVFLRLSRWRQA